jgi:hypothetical protein
LKGEVFWYRLNCLPVGIVSGPFRESFCPFRRGLEWD